MVCGITAPHKSKMRAAESRSHLTMSAARMVIVEGTARSKASAVLRLTTSSNLGRPFGSACALEHEVNNLRASPPLRAMLEPAQ